MQYVNFEGSNALYKAPESMKDRCGDLPALVGIDDAGDDYILSAWQPSPEDVESIKAGHPVFLKIIGKGMPPVSLFTLGQDGQVNP